MKVAITGHTRGIGKAIADKFESKGYEIVGLSKSNGYDLSNEEQKEKALNQIIGCDIFINNAFVSFRDPAHNKSYTPIELLLRVHKFWMGKSDKKIVVIGSWASNFHKLDYEYTGYQVHKYALEKACWQLSMATLHPKIFLLKPGRVDTAMTVNRSGPKMDPSDVANVVEYVLDSEPNHYIREITFTAGIKHNI
jgi:NAD(P)-dependent dehydrogenase (short-subunit alcohol dehydrogenase family)